MLLEGQGIAFLPEGLSVPSGSYPISCKLEVAESGAATGGVHFFCEPKYPRPIGIGIEFDVHIPHPDSILGDYMVLHVRFVDEHGSIKGYVHGSSGQFHPEGDRRSTKSEDAPMSARDVFVIHGRDERLRSGMFEFLRSLGLNPMEWSHAIELTGKGTPYVGEVLDVAFSHAQAVVVLFTPDDVAKLRPELCGDEEPEHEINLTPQARANVLFESGMAMARHPNRTIMVEVGKLRPFSDVGGRHTIRMDNSSKKRNELATRLGKAGCPVNLAGTDWQTTGDLRPPELRLGPKPRRRPLRIYRQKQKSSSWQCLRIQMALLSVPRRHRDAWLARRSEVFSEDNNPRSQARWKAAVRELVTLNLLEPLGEEGNVFGITDAGYKGRGSLSAGSKYGVTCPHLLVVII